MKQHDDKKVNFLYFLLFAGWKLWSFMPLQVMYGFSDGLFYLFYYLIRYRRNITRKNLCESFPEKNVREIQKIEKRFYRFFLDMVFETCKMASISPKGISNRMKFTNLEAIKSILKQEKSISLYLGHYGNWEWVSSLPLHLDKKTDVIAGQIYRKLNNKAINQLLLQNRGRMGALCIEMKEAPRRINEFVGNKKVTIVGYIADQSPKKRFIRHFTPFFNHHTPVLVGSEKITKHYGFEAWYLHIKRLKRGYYEATFVPLHENPPSLPDFELTDIFYRHLEETIRTQPELYLWTHNRFKYAKK